ncbi:MAG: M20 family metallopeptidase [Ktedonobacteraceae bacterium]
MLTYAQSYLPWLQTYQQEMLQRLELLVNIDSGTGQVAGVNQIMTHLEQWLRDTGFIVTLNPSERFGNNLVARRAGRLGLQHPRILLVGHVDTVYAPGAVALQPFRIEDDLAYGPGVIDMKSGVIMGIYALRALLDSGFEQYAELCVVFNNDEETGSGGSGALLREISRQVDLGLVLEPTRSATIVTNARKGADRYSLEVTGVPAHSGAEPHRGRSAVIELAHKMLAVHHLHTLFPGTTFNVTRLSSSELLNVVPDTARCWISVRAHSDEALDAAAAALASIAAGCSVPGTHTTLARTRGRTPYRATPELARMVEVARLEAEALGVDLIAEGKGGVSDANLLMAAGVPTLDSLGPVGGGMHDMQREHLHVDSLSLRGALLAGLIHHLCHP